MNLLIFHNASKADVLNVFETIYTNDMHTIPYHTPFCDSFYRGIYGIMTPTFMTGVMHKIYSVVMNSCKLFREGQKIKKESSYNRFKDLLLLYYAGKFQKRNFLIYCKRQMLCYTIIKGQKQQYIEIGKFITCMVEHAFWEPDIEFTGFLTGFRVPTTGLVSNSKGSRIGGSGLLQNSKSPVVSRNTIQRIPP